MYITVYECKIQKEKMYFGLFYAIFANLLIFVLF